MILGTLKLSTFVPIYSKVTTILPIGKSVIKGARLAGLHKSFSRI